MNTDRKKILLVDDEPDILEFVKYNLEKEGYEVLTALSGLEAIEIAESEIPALIVVDVMMPGMDGVETCVRLRENKKLDDTIITFLTARNEDFTQIAGFDAGADDYITKPIKPRVLVSRIKALLRRSSGTSEVSETSKDLGGIVIDRNKYSVFKEGVEIDLPKKEFELLSLLASKPGNVFTREVILDRVWGGEVIVGDRTIDVHVRKLREKLGEEIIKTIKGVGYKFDTR
jgi:two-component system, OmpR family, alkaline phosphatase synthesis response regulator PhoP